MIKRVCFDEAGNLLEVEFSDPYPAHLAATEIIQLQNYCRQHWQLSKLNPYEESASKPQSEGIDG